MAGLMSVMRKTLKRSTNVVRRVGKVTRGTVKMGTNTLGLTKRSRKAHHKGSRSAHRKSRKGSRSAHRKGGRKH